MACCGPSISNIDSEKLLKELRNNREIIPLKLNEASYGFHPKSSKWKSNEYIIIIYIIIIGNLGKSSILNMEDNDEEIDADDSKDQEKYNELKKESSDKDEKIKVLEKKYLESISKLLIMIQVHCEIKTDMYKKFAESGLTEDKKEK